MIILLDQDYDTKYPIDIVIIRIHECYESCYSWYQSL